MQLSLYKNPFEFPMPKERSTWAWHCEELPFPAPQWNGENYKTRNGNNNKNNNNKNQSLKAFGTGPNSKQQVKRLCKKIHENLVRKAPVCDFGTKTIASLYSAPCPTVLQTVAIKSTGLLLFYGLSQRTSFRPGAELQHFSPSSRCLMLSLKWFQTGCKDSLLLPNPPQMG